MMFFAGKPAKAQRKHAEARQPFAAGSPETVGGRSRETLTLSLSPSG